jgi:Fic family protein
VRLRGDWEGWLKFFLRGIHEVSEDAAATARAVLRLREQDRRRVVQEFGANPLALALLDLLFQQPLLNLGVVSERLECVFSTASKLVDRFVDLGLLRETTGRQRDRRYQYDAYLQLFGATD